MAEREGKLERKAGGTSKIPEKSKEGSYVTRKESKSGKEKKQRHSEAKAEKKRSSAANKNTKRSERCVLFSRANKRKKIRRRRGTIPRKITTTYNRKRSENNEEFRKVQTREKTRIDEITSGRSIFYEFYKNVYSTRNRRRTKKVNCETVEEIDNCYLASSDKGWKNLIRDHVAPTSGKLIVHLTTIEKADTNVVHLASLLQI